MSIICSGSCPKPQQKEPGEHFLLLLWGKNRMWEHWFLRNICSFYMLQLNLASMCPAVFLRNVDELRSGCRGPAFKCVCSWALVTIFALIPALLILTGYCCCLFCQFSIPPFPLPPWVSISTQVPSKWQCWLVAVCRAGSRSQGWYGTSLLCLELLLGPHHPLMAPVPKLIYGWLV